MRGLFEAEDSVEVDHPRWAQCEDAKRIRGGIILANMLRPRNIPEPFYAEDFSDGDEEQAVMSQPQESSE